MQREEQLSTFLDGELSESESRFLLRQLSADRDGREQFDRYNLVGDIMRGGTPPVLDSGFADRVMAEISAEPAGAVDIDEPMGFAESNAAAVAVMPAPAQRADDASKHVSWARPLVSFAMAASVAVVAIVLWPNNAVQPVDGAVLASAASQINYSEDPFRTNAAVTLLPVADGLLATAPDERALEATWELADPEVQRRLSEYVADYSKFSTAPAGQYSTPFSQTVGFQGRGIQDHE